MTGPEVHQLQKRAKDYKVLICKLNDLMNQSFVSKGHEIEINCMTVHFSLGHNTVDP